MEAVAGDSTNATVMEAPRSTLHTTVPDYSMVGGALVGRRGHLQTQRGELCLEQLGTLGISDAWIKEFAEEYALTAPLARYIYSPPHCSHR